MLDGIPHMLRVVKEKIDKSERLWQLHSTCICAASRFNGRIVLNRKTNVVGWRKKMSSWRNPDHDGSEGNISPLWKFLDCRRLCDSANAERRWEDFFYYTRNRRQHWRSLTTMSSESRSGGDERRDLKIEMKWNRAFVGSSFVSGFFFGCMWVSSAGNSEIGFRLNQLTSAHPTAAFFAPLFHWKSLLLFRLRSDFSPRLSQELLLLVSVVAHTHRTNRNVRGWIFCARSLSLVERAMATKCVKSFNVLDEIVSWGEKQFISYFD